LPPKERRVKERRGGLSSVDEMFINGEGGHKMPNSKKRKETLGGPHRIGRREAFRRGERGRKKTRNL